MTKHRTGTRKEWRGERLKLLEAEKEFTRRCDELAFWQRSRRVVMAMSTGNDAVY
jgi:predicted dithiol-disulfide oxidoreductase (DUF899 family)